ncbi:MAG: hypothetical protein K2W82_13560 [Candidatus Obscuribacterales bacterium]|nr:hypothetical protein [Candidatus Obscuribacterales bacterium]
MQSLDLSNTFVFDRVLFFGRSFAEYMQMFDLQPEKLIAKSLLDCSAGPASFACEASELGAQVIACDPLYGTTLEELSLIYLLQREEALTRQPKVEHLFDQERNIAEFKQEKVKALQKFSADYSTHPERYIKASLPELPFADRSFDVTLSSNFLFLYADYDEGGMLVQSPFDYDFHLQAILELVRVSKEEVRLYPLKGPHRSEHGFVARICADLSARGIESEIVPVAYRDIKDAHQMLRVKLLRPERF